MDRSDWGAPVVVVPTPKPTDVRPRQDGGAPSAVGAGLVLKGAKHDQNALRSLSIQSAQFDIASAAGKSHRVMDHLFRDCSG